MPKFMNLYSFLKMDKATEGNQGGGGGGNNQNNQQQNNQNNQQQQNQGGSVTMSKEQFDAIMARLPKAEQQQQQNQQQNNQQQSGAEDDLAAKAKKEADLKAAKKVDSASLESALRFNLGSAEWLKTNAALLPKDIQSIFAQAEKETFDDAVQKASAIKSGVMQEFFKVQANLDLLTGPQKTTLEDWLKLTKNGKEEKAQQIFDVVFEPTFEMLRRVKKAEQVSQSGSRDSNQSEDAYKQKLINGSRQHYMGEKKNA